MTRVIAGSYGRNDTIAVTVAGTALSTSVVLSLPHNIFLSMQLDDQNSGQLVWTVTLVIALSSANAGTAAGVTITRIGAEILHPKLAAPGWQPSGAMQRHIFQTNQAKGSRSSQANGN